VPASYPEILDFLFTRLPVFQRIGDAAYKPGLDTILNFCKEIGDPQTKFPTVHIAGTNGKGSSSHSIASVFQEAGYKTGLYTSPHLVDFRERIRINGNQISESEVVETIESWRQQIDRFEPSFFELTVALAFHHFAMHRVDVAIVEVGMGGRLDSTNIINPDAALITNISYDHQKFLGDTLEKIAGEKAGIMKPGVPTIIGEYHSETKPVFETQAKIKECPLLFAQEVYMVRGETTNEQVQVVTAYNLKTKEIRIHNLSLLGHYQLKNLPGILTTLDVLKNKGWKISGENIKNGLSRVQQNTGLMGRWQVLHRKPLIIADTAHNEAGIKLVMEQLESLGNRNKIFIWGMVNDKDHNSIINLIPKTSTIFVTEPAIPRKQPKEELLTLFLQSGFDAQLKDSVEIALQDALKLATEDDLIFIGGSTFTVADIPFEKFQKGN